MLLAWWSLPLPWAHRQAECAADPIAFHTMTTLTCLLATVLAIITIPLLVLYLLTETRPQRARRWRRGGMTQQQIADRLGVSRTTVRRMLVA